ncbi:MAG: dihydroorotate dehydrogenase electron transfer subunit [Nitrospiraceae bacterium]|nr:MAG: dihydroorotate dehydrogenase electron transfer subunit [Nitrospiraceae bacterium]
MSRYFTATITANLSLNSRHFLMELTSPKNENQALPGQFYMIGAGRGYDPLLKRAFSLFRNTPDGFQILYRIQGRGTALMRDMKAGTSVEVLGPLGRPYPEPSKKQTSLVIAGGVGIASVFSLVEKFPKQAYMLYGARSGEDLFYVAELRDAARALILSTDDGSLGKKGTVMDSLQELVSTHAPLLNERLIMYACGPEQMLREVSHFGMVHNIQTYISFEAHMACGVGACLSCAVAVKKKKRKQKSYQDGEPLYKKVCTDGPVFDAGDVAW